MTLAKIPAAYFHFMNRYLQYLHGRIGQATVISIRRQFTRYGARIVFLQDCQKLASALMELDLSISNHLYTYFERVYGEGKADLHNLTEDLIYPYRKILFPAVVYHRGCQEAMLEMYDVPISPPEITIEMIVRGEYDISTISD